MGLFMRDFISLDELFTGRPLVGLREDKSFEKRIEAFHSVGVGNWICAYTCYIGTATNEYSSPSVQEHSCGFEHCLGERFPLVIILLKFSHFLKEELLGSTASL